MQIKCKHIYIQTCINTYPYTQTHIHTYSQAGIQSCIHIHTHTEGCAKSHKVHLIHPKPLQHQQRDLSHPRRLKSPKTQSVHITCTQDMYVIHTWPARSECAAHRAFGHPHTYNHTHWSWHASRAHTPRIPRAYNNMQHP